MNKELKDDLISYRKQYEQTIDNIARLQKEIKQQEAKALLLDGAIQALGKFDIEQTKEANDGTIDSVPELKE